MPRLLHVFRGTRSLVQVHGGIAVVESIELPERAHPAHRHQREDETVYVLEGSLAVVVGGRRARVDAGRAAFLPRGVDHAIAACGGSARILTIFTPGGFEEYLAAIEHHDVGVDPESSLVSLEELVALAARHGCEITGPALVCSQQSALSAFPPGSGRNRTRPRA